MYGVRLHVAVTPPHQQMAPTMSSSVHAVFNNPTCLRPEGCCERREGTGRSTGMSVLCVFLSSLLNKVLFNTDEGSSVVLMYSK